MAGYRRDLWQLCFPLSKGVNMSPTVAKKRRKKKDPIYLQALSVSADLSFMCSCTFVWTVPSVFSRGKGMQFYLCVISKSGALWSVILISERGPRCVPVVLFVSDECFFFQVLPEGGGWAMKTPTAFWITHLNITGQRQTSLLYLVQKKEKRFFLVAVVEVLFVAYGWSRKRWMLLDIHGTWRQLIYCFI